MPKVIFSEPNGAQREIDASLGESLMQAATNNLIKGIDADCGGMGICATCHVHISAPWANNLPAMNDSENQMLDMAEGRDALSRLACQVTVSDEMEGMRVKVAEHQH